MRRIAFFGVKISLFFHNIKQFFLESIHHWSIFIYFIRYVVKWDCFLIFCNACQITLFILLVYKWHSLLSTKTSHDVSLQTRKREFLKPCCCSLFICIHKSSRDLFILDELLSSRDFSSSFVRRKHTHTLIHQLPLN